MFTTLDDERGFISSLELEEITFKVEMQRTTSGVRFSVFVYVDDGQAIHVAGTVGLGMTVDPRPIDMWEYALFAARRAVAEQFEDLRRKYLMKQTTVQDEAFLRALLGNCTGQELEVLKP